MSSVSASEDALQFIDMLFEASPLNVSPPPGSRLEGAVGALFGYVFWPEVAFDAESESLNVMLTVV